MLWERPAPAWSYHMEVSQSTTNSAPDPCLPHCSFCQQLALIFLCFFLRADVDLSCEQKTVSTLATASLCPDEGLRLLGLIAPKSASICFCWAQLIRQVCPCVPGVPHPCVMSNVESCV